MDGGTWVGYSPRGRKESDTTERLHFLSFQILAGVKTGAGPVGGGASTQPLAGDRYGNLNR